MNFRFYLLDFIENAHHKTLFAILVSVQPTFIAKKLLWTHFPKAQKGTDDFFAHVSYYDAARLAHVSGLETLIGSFLEKDFYCSISFSNEIKKTLTTWPSYCVFGICTHESFAQTCLSSDCKYWYCPKLYKEVYY